MKNDLIEKFHTEVCKFIRTFSNDVNKDFTEDKIYQVIRDIPRIIEGFKDCDSEEKYRLLAKKQDGTLAEIQVVDPGTGYKVYKKISSEEYKNLYYECLMYALILYEVYWKNYEYIIVNEYDQSKEGVLCISDESLPHLLGIDAKYIGECALLESIILGYSKKNVVEQILSIIFNYELIKKYEEKNGVEIFNYYKSMQKVKSFLLLGRVYCNFDDSMNNKVLILDREDSDNQLWLVKKSNMNSSMSENIIRILLQRNSDGHFFPRSIQAISDEIELEYLAAPYIRKGVTIDSLSDEEKLRLLNMGLMTKNPFLGIHLNEPVIEPNINPHIFGSHFSAPAILRDDFDLVLNYFNDNSLNWSNNIKKI